MVLVFEKTCFKVKDLKTFKISTDCHLKTCRSLKRRANLKISSAVFFEELRFFLSALKQNLYKEAFSSAVKFVERSSHSFSVYLMNQLAKTSVLLINYKSYNNGIMKR